MTSELKKIYRINQKYLTNEEYFRFGDSESYIAKADYEDSNFDIIPTANPKESNTTQKMLKAQILMEASQGDPDADRKAIKKNFLEAAGLSDEEYQKFFPGQTEPPPPSSEDIKNTADAKSKEADSVYKIAKAENTQADTVKKVAESIKTVAEAEAIEPGQQIEAYKAIVGGLNGGNNTEGNRGVEAPPSDQMGIQEQIPEMGAGGIDQLAGESEGLIQ